MLSTNALKNRFIDRVKHLKDQGVPQHLAIGYLEDLNKESKVYTPSVLSSIMDEIYNNGLELPERRTFDLSERGAAQRLISLVGEEIRYSEPTNSWMMWNGRVWSDKGTTSKITRMVELVADLYKEDAIKAQKAGREKEWGRLNNLYMRFSQEKGITSLLRYAARIHTFEEPEVDEYKYLFNTFSGVVDMRTGNLLPHDPKYMMTRIAPVFFNPEAKCPRWISFLGEIFEEDNELINYLQEMVGYFFSEDVGGEQFFYFYGPTGRNGKSKFVSQLTSILGTGDDGYAASIPSETLTISKPGTNNYTLAKLKGKRFVTVPETDRGKKFSASVIKQLTGGDVIMARKLYREPFNFKPSLKLVIVGNYELNISGSDSAFFSRLVVIPFNVRIPDDKQDPELETKLKAEMSGILNWAIEGSIRWWNNRQKGISSLKKLPVKVKEATLKYQQDMDELGSFFEEMLIVDTDLKVGTKQLYDAYVDFTNYEKGSYPLGKQNFNQTMRARGYMDKKSNGKSFWFGLGLKSEVKKEGLKVVK